MQMKIQNPYIEKMKFTAIAAWFLVILILVAGYRVITAIVVFVLSKLYEIFIQNQAIKI